MSLRSGAFALMLLAGTWASPGLAQETSTPNVPDGWSFRVAPYLWAAGMKGEVATLPPAPPAEIDMGFDDIVRKLDMAFMGFGEVRWRRFAVAADIVYMNLSHDAETPGPFYSSADLKMKSFIGTFQGSYRVLAAEQGYLDLLAGARVWNVHTKLDLAAGLASATNRNERETWVDPVIGVQGQVRLGAGFYLTAAGNVGGFGAGSDLTWDVFGGLGYQALDWLTPVIGYRYLSVDYDNDDFLFDVDVSGPMIGVVFRF